VTVLTKQLAARVKPLAALIGMALLCLSPAAGQATDEAGWGATVATTHVSSRLVAERGAVAPGKTVLVVLDQTIIPDWHTYWQNPGDTGLPTKIRWVLPPGWKAGPITWPAPSVFKTGALVNYGYHDHARLITELTAPADAAVGQPAAITAEATWLVCKDICIPERASLPLTLGVDPTPSAGGPQTAALFKAAAAALPRVAPKTLAFVGGGAGGAEIVVPMSGAQAQRMKSAYFFSEDPKLVAPSAVQTATTDATGLHLKLATAGAPADGSVRGILILAASSSAIDDGPRQALLVNVRPSAAPSGTSTIVPLASSAREAPAPVLAAEQTPGTPGPATPTVAQTPSTTAVAPSAAAPPAPSAEFGGGLLQAAVLAIFGGIILNLMPCVFPILSMKALALAKHGRGYARAHGLAYAGGVMVCFVSIAAVLIALRAGGAQIGWGFQLQSPVVVAVLADVMFLLGLSMVGVFTVGSGVMGVGSGLTNNEGLTGSFFTGVLATLVATPCTAPFMGAAVGYALLQPWPAALAVFLCLGFGMALPFLLLTFFDALLRRLPRPGPWMERLKQVLAFPLFASAVWLVWVLAIQAGPNAMAIALGMMVVLGFCSWLYGLGLEGRARWFTRLAVVAAAAAIVAPLPSLLHAPAPKAASSAGLSASSEPTPYSATGLTEARAANRPVLVNMTAAWCITCLANETTSLSRERVKDAMAQKGVAYLKGDWTNQDAGITAVLQQYHRDGVPLYLLYRPGEAEPQLLPQLLSEKIVLDALAPLPNKRS
jgi:thiol:disulfide interchange protein/DsbC/DsbD-like thiol-disulfide interchange protein